MKITAIMREEGDYRSVAEAARLTHRTREDVVDAIRQGAVRSGRLGGQLLTLEDGSWLAHRDHLAVHKDDLGIIAQDKFANRHVLLALLCGGGTLEEGRKALSVWRGAALDNPRATTAAEIVDILKDYYFPCDDEEAVAA